MEVIIFAWAVALIFWTWLLVKETRDALELTRQARETAKDNLRLFSTRNELRYVEFIFTDGKTRTYEARRYSRSDGYFSVFDKDGNLIVEISEKDVKEVRLTRHTEYTYLEPRMTLEGYYVRGRNPEANSRS